MFNVEVPLGLLQRDDLTLPQKVILSFLDSFPFLPIERQSLSKIIRSNDFDRDITDLLQRGLVKMIEGTEDLRKTQMDIYLSENTMQGESNAIFYYIKDNTLNNILLNGNSFQITSLFGYLPPSHASRKKNNALVKRISSNRPVKRVPDTIQPFLDEWFIHDLHIPAETTKSFEQDIESLKKLYTGVFFEDKAVPGEFKGRGFTLEEWKRSVDNFSLACFSGDYYPVKKDTLKKTIISKFLYNPYVNGKNAPKSYFLRFLMPPDKIKKERDDPNVWCTNNFIAQYNVYHLEQYGDQFIPSPEDLDRFITASQRTVDFFKENKNKIVQYDYWFFPPGKQPEFVFEAIKHSLDGSDIKIRPGMLCSDRTFHKALPEYLMYHNLKKEV